MLHCFLAHKSTLKNTLPEKSHLSCVAVYQERLCETLHDQLQSNQVTF